MMIPSLCAIFRKTVGRKANRGVMGGGGNAMVVRAIVADQPTIRMLALVLEPSWLTLHQGKGDWSNQHQLPRVDLC